MRSALGCAALGLLLLLVAGTFDAEPLYVTGAALLLLGAGAVAVDRRSAASGATLHARARRAPVVEEQPLQVRIDAQVAAGCRCRPAGSTSRCCPSRVRLPAGRRAARACASRSRSAAAAGAGCRRPRSCCATRSGSPSA